MLKCLCARGGRIKIVIPFEIEESIDVLGRWHGVVLAEKKSVRALAVELVWLSGTLASFREESIIEMFELKTRHSRVTPAQAAKLLEAAHKRRGTSEEEPIGSEPIDILAKELEELIDEEEDESESENKPPAEEEAVVASASDASDANSESETPHRPTTRRIATTTTIHSDNSNNSNNSDNSKADRCAT